MGICASKSTGDGAVVTSVPEQAGKNSGGTGTTADDGKPQPMIFAIMRNGHEVIRDGVKEFQKKLRSGDVDDAAMYWTDLSRWLDLHKLLEEGNGSKTPKGFFRYVLD
jgi:hypothetical protein